MNAISTFTSHLLTDSSRLFIGRLPTGLATSGDAFDALWHQQPRERPWIVIHGRRVQIPRNQQAYGADYAFSGQVSHALPVPELLAPYLGWAREAVDERLNGLLVNWYDAATADYIGAHHDKTKGLVTGSPIVTISCGASRTLRLSRGRGANREVRDFPAVAGSVFVMPWDTNRVWKHEVPHFARDTGRRISITLRAFDGPLLGDAPPAA